AEDLLAGNLVVATRIGDDGRTDELAVEVAAGDDLATRLPDPVEDAFARLDVDHRADVRVLVRGVADLQCLDAGNDSRQQRFIAVLLDIDTLNRDAALAGEGESVGGDLLRSDVEVRVGGDDDGRRIPELEVHALLRRALA